MGAKHVRGSHVVITGGSTGIGLSLARQFVLRGAKLSLLSRSQAKLDAAVEELQEYARSQGLTEKLSVLAVSVDVTVPQEVPAVRAGGCCCDALRGSAGPTDVLICNAGTSTPGRFLEQPLSVHADTMQLNYFGALHAVQAALPGMVRRGAGHLVFVASAAAVCGLPGFTTYSPGKYALRGLAECLRSELLPTGVRVSITYPPDTDTPSYAVESQTKPPECHAASRAAGDVLYSPDKVAECIVRGLERGSFHLAGPDLGQNLMVAQSVTLSPRLYPTWLEALLAPLLVVALRIFGAVIDRAVAGQGRRQGKES